MALSLTLDIGCARARAKPRVGYPALDRSWGSLGGGMIERGRRRGGGDGKGRRGGERRREYLTSWCILHDAFHVDYCDASINPYRTGR